MYDIIITIVGVLVIFGGMYLLLIEAANDEDK